MNRNYTKPFGQPQHWRHSQDPELINAVNAYLESEQMLPAQQTIVIEYVRYFVEAPAYDNRPMMPFLRENLKQINTLDDLRMLLQQVQLTGVVPL